MDRSDVKLFKALKNSEKKFVISQKQNEILEQKNFTGSRLDGVPKLLKAFFSRLFLC